VSGKGLMTLTEEFEVVAACHPNRPGEPSLKNIGDEELRIRSDRSRSALEDLG